MGSYQRFNTQKYPQTYGEGVQAVIHLEEYGFPESKIPVLNIGIPAGRPVEKADESHTYAFFPFNFFPNAADGYVIHVSGDSMIGAGIEDGDLLLVDRSACPENRDIVVVGINGEMTVKRYINNGDHIVFAAENENFKPIIVTKRDDVDIFGVVIRVIKEPK